MVGIERVCAYLDGFNIYNGLLAKGWGRYRWLDYRSLVGRYMREPQQLVGITYFTSLMTHQPDKFARQRLYLRALEVRGGIEVVTGQWRSRSVQCRSCGKSFRVPQEKRTDVNLATHLVADAFDDRFDTFVLFTADTDLIPAVSLVRRRFAKCFVLIDPPKRHSDELADLADIHLRSREQYYRQSQLPDPVEYVRKGKVKRIHRPPSWASQQVQPSVVDDPGGVEHCLSCNRPFEREPTS